MAPVLTHSRWVHYEKSCIPRLGLRLSQNSLYDRSGLLSLRADKLRITLLSAVISAQCVLERVIQK